MKYIKKFESFDAKPVSKELSDVYKSAIENRFATLDGSSKDTEEVIIAPPKTKEPITRPWRPIPTQEPSPGTQEKPMGTFDEVMNMFFSELNKVKDTSEGQEMLKNIESKYGNL